MNKVRTIVDIVRHSDYYQRVTLLWLLLAAVLILIWLLTGDGNWEPVVTFTGVLAAATGFILEPGYRKKQLRREFIEAIQEEYRHNEVLLNGVICPLEPLETFDGEVIYPRLRYECLDRALRSSEISNKSDAKLLVTIRLARTEVEVFNHFLDHLERRMWDGDNGEKTRLHSLLVDSQRIKVIRYVLSHLERDVVSDLAIS